MSETLNRVMERLQKKSARVQAFMNSDIGKEVIKALEDEFYHGEMVDDDPHKTYYNLGRRDVVIYLRQLQTWRTEND